MPVIYETQKLLQIFEDYNLTTNCLTHKTLYFNRHLENDPMHPAAQTHLCRFVKSMSIADIHPDAYMLNHVSSQFKTVEPYLAELFGNAQPGINYRSLKSEKKFFNQVSNPLQT